MALSSTFPSSNLKFPNEMTGAVSRDKLLSEQFLQFKEGVTEVTRSLVQAQSFLKIHTLTVLNIDQKG